MSSKKTPNRLKAARFSKNWGELKNFQKIYREIVQSSLTKDSCKTIKEEIRIYARPGKEFMIWTTELIFCHLSL